MKNGTIFWEVTREGGVTATAKATFHITVPVNFTKCFYSQNESLAIT